MKLKKFRQNALHSRAQLSLEYLILLAAALAVLAMLAPVLGRVYGASVFSLDAANAKAFSSRLQSNVQTMSIQADGSQKQIEAKPFGKWLLSSNGNSLKIEVLGPEGKTKPFEVAFPNKVAPTHFAFSEKTVFTLFKKGGKILLKNNNP